MTRANFDIVWRAFWKRRPFRPFVLEFASGGRLRIVHPEALRLEASLIVYRAPTGEYTVSEVEQVARLTDSAADT